MKKIKLYIAASIDGYIARSNGDLDWLMKYPITSELNYGYDDFFASIDTVVMGGRTYRDIVNMDVIYPYEGKTSYIITHNPVNLEKNNIRFVANNIIETISQLKEENGKDIWLVGGGEIIAMLLKQDLIDEMIITQIPIMLGNGIPLFLNNQKESRLNLENSIQYKNGVLQMTYTFVR